MTTNKSTRRLLVATLAAATTISSTVRPARADEVAPTGKGIAGGALLGGEVVAITESLAGLRTGWIYAVTAGAGMVAGGLGGFAVESAEKNSSGLGATYMLAGGMILIIPALVLSLNATRYHPSENATEDKPPPGIPADPGLRGGSPATGPGAAPPSPAPGPPPPAAPAGPPVAPPPPTSLLDWRTHETPLRLGLPVPEVRPMYTAAEMKAYGVQQQTEVRMPVLRVTF